MLAQAGTSRHRHSRQQRGPDGYVALGFYLDKFHAYCYFTCFDIACKHNSGRNRTTSNGNSPSNGTSNSTDQRDDNSRHHGKSGAVSGSSYGYGHQ